MVNLLNFSHFYRCEELTHWKRLWCWEGLGAGGEGDDRGWDGWMASLTWWTWVWVNSGSWWWTGAPGVLWFMGSKRVGHDWATELNWTEIHHGSYLGIILQWVLTIGTFSSVITVQLSPSFNISKIFLSNLPSVSHCVNSPSNALCLLWGLNFWWRWTIFLLIKHSSRGVCLQFLHD